MKPSMTIVQYLYSGRNTWLRHHEDCECEPEELIYEVLDQLEVNVYGDVVTDELGTYFKMREKADEEWDQICGPAAEDRVLAAALEQYMDAASQIVAAQATKERLRSE